MKTKYASLLRPVWSIILNFLNFYYSNWTEDVQRFPLLTKVRTSS